MTTLPTIEVEIDDTPLTLDPTEVSDLLTDGLVFPTFPVTIRVGGAAFETQAELMAGYLPRGASGDIDGSGLALWGDAQPGGWRVCEGDGQTDPRPSVDALRGSVVVGGVVTIGPDDVPEWAADPDGETYAERLAEAIEEAIEEAWLRQNPPEVVEPTPEELYDAMDEIDGWEAAPVRLGYCGERCGHGPALLAWIEDGETRSVHSPDLEDIHTAAEAATACLAADMAAGLRKLTGEACS